MQAGDRGWSLPRADSFKQAEKFAKKSFEINDSLPSTHNFFGFMHLDKRQYNEARTEFQKAVDLNPNYALGYYNLGRTLFYTGQPDEAIPLFKKAMRIQPHCPWYIPFMLGKAYYHSGRYEDALAMFKQVLKLCEEGSCYPTQPHLLLSAVYIELGRDEETRAHMQKVLEYNPRYNIESLRKALKRYDQAILERELAAFLKAGLPEHPPSQ